MQKYIPPSERLNLTPLIDIAFLVLIFFMSLPLKQLAAKLETHLPTDHGITQEPARRRDEIPIRVREDSFQLGDRRVQDMRELLPVLGQLGGDNTYVIRATPAISWERIVTVVDTLAGMKFKHVEFYGTARPKREIRRSVPLPMPTD